MERRAQAAEQLAARSSGQAALDYLIKAADFYMRATSETQDKSHIASLRRRCRDVLARGEIIKRELAAASASASDSESITQSTCRLHGNNFPPWDRKPSQDEFDARSDGSLFTDDAVYTMSAAQEAILDGWKRPHHLLKTQPGDDDTLIFMDSTKGCDLVQDVTTDCSVVASLSAALGILTGKRKVLSSIICPFNHETGLPQFSGSGKYVLRMHFNGCARRVVVDDRLPMSRTDRTLFVVDRRNPHLIWPAILEKAYLKVRGGYDFPGSNSGTDLWVITGWIPEQVFLQKEDLELNEMWTRIKTAHDFEDVAVTLGTGRITPEEENVTGLIGEHDYAVVGLDDSNGVRQLLLKNPWCDGPPSRGPHRLATGILDDVWSQPRDASSGLQVMTLEDVVQNFESMYLNWNPKLFPHRQDHHFLWDVPKGALAASLVRNPQHALTPTAPGLVWILVSRHFVDAELEIARHKPDPASSPNTPQLGFMSILVFESDGKRVHVGDGELFRSPYVDTPQTLARLDASPGTTYTVVLDQHELPLPSYTFSMSVFSQKPVHVSKAQESLTSHHEISGSWKRRTAGGSAASPTFGTNPQYQITLPRATPLSLLLATDAADIPVHIDLLWAQGQRVHEVKVRDLVVSSGDYRRGCAVASIASVEAGTYTLVCSTFEPGQLADFTLRICSAAPLTTAPIPAAGAGRMKSPLPPTTFLAGQHRQRARVSVPWLTRVSVSLATLDSAPRRAPYAVRASSGLMIRLCVAFGWEPNQTTVAETGDGTFRDVTSTLRTGDFDLDPERAAREGCWLVMESMGNHAVETPVIEGEVLSDAPIQVGAWEPVP